MKFIKKTFLSLTFLFIGLNQGLYSMEEIGTNVQVIEIPTESSGSWLGWMPEVPSMPKIPSFSVRDTLSNAGSKVGSFFGYNGPFKFAHSGAEELTLLNEQKSSALEIGQELLNSAQRLENIGSEVDVTSIQQARECLNPFVENMQQQVDLIKANAATRYIEQPASWLDWLLGRDNFPEVQTTYPLHDADGITTDATRRYAVDLFKLKQKGFSELEQCLGFVENQELIAPLKTEVLQGQDEVNAQASQLRLDSLKYNFSEFAKQAWQIPAVKAALVAGGAALAPVILYKLYRSLLYPIRGIKGISHNNLVKKETELLAEIQQLNIAPDGEEEAARTTRLQNLAIRNAELFENTKIKRNYEQYACSTVATKPYIWSLQKLGNLGYNSIAKAGQASKWAWRNKKIIAPLTVLGATAAATTVAAQYYDILA